ncbi:MAG: hypothetical protein ACMG6S_30250, partial [Byssovorax sp.]
MLWILSTLRVLLGSVQQGACRAVFLLLLVLATALGGAACRGEEAALPRGEDVELDDSDASPIAGAIQGSFAVSSSGEA